MKKLSLLLATTLTMIHPVVHGADAPAPDTQAPGGAVVNSSLAAHLETLADETNRMSYALGVNIARNLKANSTSVNPDFVKLGISDVFDGRKVKLNEDIINSSIAHYSELANSHVKKKFEDFKEKNLREAEHFLEENGKKEGVVTLPSGLEYKVISPGKGPKPKPDGVAVVQYHGVTLRGLVVDSTLEGTDREPKQIQINDALPFWKEILPMMPLGAKWELYVHPKLAYGDVGHGKIAPNELLKYSVEIVGVQ